MKTEYILYGVGGLVLLYLLMKKSTGFPIVGASGLVIGTAPNTTTAGILSTVSSIASSWLASTSSVNSSTDTPVPTSGAVNGPPLTAGDPNYSDGE